MFGYSFSRASTCSRVGIAEIPSPSTENDAAHDANRVAFQTSPLSHRRMRKAAAKTSPAPCRIDDIGREGVDVPPVAAHADVRAVVAARETDDLDVVRPVGERGRGLARRDVLVREEERAGVAEHLVSVEVGRHDRPHAVVPAGAPQPALSADSQQRQVEYGRKRLFHLAHHRAEEHDRRLTPFGRQMLRC